MIGIMNADHNLMEKKSYDNAMNAILWNMWVKKYFRPKINEHFSKLLNRNILHGLHGKIIYLFLFMFLV